MISEYLQSVDFPEYERRLYIDLPNLEDHDVTHVMGEVLKLDFILLSVHEYNFKLLNVYLLCHNRTLSCGKLP